jgi:hypothetical protein
MANLFLSLLVSDISFVLNLKSILPLSKHNPCITTVFAHKIFFFMLIQKYEINFCQHVNTGNLIFLILSNIVAN